MGKKDNLKIAFFISDSGVRDRQRLYEFQVEVLNSVEQHYYILSGNKHFISFLEANKISFTILNYVPKSIFDIAKAAFALRKELTQYDVVHTHYHDANFLGLLAARIAGVPIRIYTRHHNSYYHDHNIRKSILVNRFFNYLSTRVVAPSESVKTTLVCKEKVTKRKIDVIHHPFKVENIQIKDLRKELGLETSDIIVGSIATFQPLKGLDYLIKAFKDVHERYPKAKLVMANAHGTHLKVYKLLAESLFESEHVRYIEYENSVESVYALFDVFVHVPVASSSEAFGQVFIEAMAFGVPSVFTASGVLPEIGRHNWNCQIVPFRDSKGVTKAIITYLENKPLQDKVVMNGLRTVKDYFDLTKFRKGLLASYTQE